ncbi:unnamed protein product [Didymodactylos carnosus]|nr:unnamed protein product [Didymodactylos carnosus]CAF3684102.1 unnamed protein product [Didymodactylos carnosus]
MSAKKASKRQRTRISTHDVVKTSNVHTSNYLSEDAVSILNSWYYSHIEKPYPTSDQKSELAEQCGVSLKKVSTWFNNRRTRSNNTRPKQKIAELQRQVKILQEKTFL